MCLSLVGQVRSVAGADAVVAVDGADGDERPVSLVALVLDGTTVAPGDWVVVQTGLAVSVLDEDEAEAVLTARRAMEEETG